MPPTSPAASAAEAAPLIPGGCMRRLAVSERFAQRSGSFCRDVGRAAADTFLLTRLTFILLRYLGIGYRWIQQSLALCCYTLLLMSGFIQDWISIYLLAQQVEAGCGICRWWSMGHRVSRSTKGGGALLGRRLAERGIIVACIDYRNFPQGTIGDMVEDASQGLLVTYKLQKYASARLVQDSLIQNYTYSILQGMTMS